MQNPINVQKPAFTKGPFSIAVELIIDGAIGPDLGPDFRFFDHSASRVTVLANHHDERNSLGAQSGLGLVPCWCRAFPRASDRDSLTGPGWP